MAKKKENYSVLTDDREPEVLIIIIHLEEVLSFKHISPEYWQLYIFNNSLEKITLDLTSVANPPVADI